MCSRSRAAILWNAIALQSLRCVARAAAGQAPIAWSLASSNHIALNSVLTVRPLALNVALGLIACPLMKVHGVAANRRHPNSSLA